MRPIEVRLVGRFRFASRVPGPHEHLLYKGVHTQTQETVFMKGEEYKLRPNDIISIATKYGSKAQKENESIPGTNASGEYTLDSGPLALLQHPFPIALCVSSEQHPPGRHQAD